jgi:asparagine synthase (glutamine-hydrolysing)
MCGIAGSFGSSERDTVAAMLDTLVHRGPDDGHFVSGRGFVLGARRLSIMDLEAGRQPLSNETGRIWACQNGEIYNFPELRPALVARGHQLRTHCDTEVLPHLYEEHGAELPRHIDGMFAVAVWDETTQTGLLARDRMGKKPLYYLQQAGALYFASEIKALLCVPGFERRLNLEALHHFLSYKHVPHPLSIFEGINQLPPAHALIVRPGMAAELRRYWEVPSEEDPELARLPEEELVERLLTLLRAGVRRRLMADVPIGFFLSGGLDSSLSTVLAAELCPGRIKTFTLTYEADSTTPGKEQDRTWARWVAQRYGTEHLEETISCDDFPANFRAALRAFDEPFAGVISSYFLARLISRHVKVALSGDGADELFGSYLSHRLAFPLEHYQVFRDRGNASPLQPFEQRLDYLATLADADDCTWRSRLFVNDERDKRALYAPATARALRQCATPAHLRQAFAGLEHNDALNRILKAEFRGIFPDQVLAFVDRLSMAHSLEIRSAFLDTDLVSFVARLPGQWKIRAGETKYLLKRAAEQFFPGDMVYRPKEGFVLPVNGWLARNLEPYVRDTLSPTALARHGLFEPTEVCRLVNDFYAGQSNHANKILCLLAFQEWYSLYLPALPSRMMPRAA